MSPKPSRRDRVIKILEQRGCRVTTCRSAKYIQLTRPDDPERFYFVGRTGALRAGKNVSDSISLSHLVKLS